MYRYLPGYLLRTQCKQLYILRCLSSANLGFINASLPIIEELYRTTNINARVNIITEVPIVVHSCDVYKYVEGNTFHARLRSSIPTLNAKGQQPTPWFKWLKKEPCKAKEKQEIKESNPNRGCMQVVISSDQNTIDVILHKKNCAANAYCEIDVPIFADLMIDAFDKVSINGLHSEDLVVSSAGDIFTTNVHCQRDINLCSSNGSIFCKKMLMGKTIQLSTSKKHPIILDVVTGGKLHALTEDGNIKTNSVYAMCSRFESKTGSLLLKNIHKHSEIVMHGKGSVQMEGTRAELDISAGDATLDLQLAYVSGDSVIYCNEAAANIGISDKVEKMVDLDICSTCIKLDNSLESLQKFISEDKTKLEHKIKDNNKDRLTIRGKCAISLFQQLWINKLVNKAQNQAKNP